jgi:hypothetical protein
MLAEAIMQPLQDPKLMKCDPIVSHETQAIWQLAIGGPVAPGRQNLRDIFATN